MQLADFNTASTDISLKLFQVGLYLIDIFLVTVDIAAQKDRLVTGLPNARFKLEHA